MVQTIGKANLLHLIDLQEAKALFDQDRERQKILTETKQLARQIVENDEPIYLKELAVNGKDVSALGFRGKGIRDALNYVLHKVYENPQLNERETLLHLLKKP